MTEWIKDERRNRASIDFWGSKEAARNSLATLIYCHDCAGCADCTGCVDCTLCTRCVDCTGCAGCVDCTRCADCAGCAGCADCAGCAGCTRCAGCADCAGCAGCVDSIDPPQVIPQIENIHAAIYAAASQPGALKMTAWHTCSNTHCRAGWVVALAGGERLEATYGTPLAAMMIYDASTDGFKINPCRFFDSNEDALADMKRMAEGATP